MVFKRDTCPEGTKTNKLPSSISLQDLIWVILVSTARLCCLDEQAIYHKTAFTHQDLVEVERVSYHFNLNITDFLCQP